MLIFFAVVFMLICAFIGAVIGEARGRNAAGFWLGLLLGPIGCLAAFFLPKE